jgi:8-amino-7-oxononanoate synthase
MKRGSSRSAPAATRWIDRWLDACSDLADLSRSNPMTDAVIDEIDGRMIRIGDAWLADFASCNYLGFDLEREIIDAVPEYLERWGTHPSWSRLLGSPVLYEQIEERPELLDAEDTLVLPTITLIHMSVIPCSRAAAIFLEAAPTRRSTTAASWHGSWRDGQTIRVRGRRRPGAAAA